MCHKLPPFFSIACPERPAIAPFVVAPFFIVPFVIAPFPIVSSVFAPFVIASPAGAKQSSDTLEKIASLGKERPPRNDMTSLPPNHGFERLPIGVGEAHALAILEFDVICSNALDPFAAQVRERLG